MISIDTNILVRFLTADDPSQARKVKVLLDSISARQERVFVPLLVLIETLWVLRRGYNLAKEDLIGALQDLLLHRLFEIEDRESVEESLELFRAGQADFSDYVIAFRCARSGNAPLTTFDKKCREPDLFKILK